MEYIQRDLEEKLSLFLKFGGVYTLPCKTAQLSPKAGYNSKKYLFDTGIANFILTRLLPVQFGDGNQSAAMLLENGVLQDCISCANSINAIETYRSNNKSPTELDFVVSGKKRLIPIEVKSSARLKMNTISQMLDFMERAHIEEGYVVYNGLPETSMIKGKTIHQLPPYLVLDAVGSQSSN